MNQKKQFYDQRDFLSQLKESTLDLLRHIDFLNEEHIDVRQLDIDLFKKRIHTVYEILCDFKPLSKSYSEAPSEPIASFEKKEEIVIEEPIQEIIEPLEITDEVLEQQEIADEKPQEELQNAFEQSPATDFFEPKQEFQKESAPTQQTDNYFQNEPKEKDIFIRFESLSEPEPIQPESFLFEPEAEQTNVSQNEQKSDPKPIESIAERFVKQEDDSIAAKLQQQPIKELKSAIGINDKFLLLNELFSGSIEKYNKVMDEFEKFQTLNGARTFLLETKIDMQWDTQSEAYKKLESLLMRKYGFSI